LTLEDVGIPPSALHRDEVVRPAPAGASRRRGVLAAGVGLALVVGVIARFVTVSPLWLDEALTVNIARLPLGEIPEALRHDGAPPLYYLMLHGWMAVFGGGDVATRALSGIFAVASLPLMWPAGRRLMADGPERMSRWVAWAAVLLLASSPFSIRYATEVRMYSLVVFLVLAGFLALDAILRDLQPSRWATVVLALATGLLLLTHYWGFFLVAAVAALLAPRLRDADPVRRRGARRALSAMAGGSLLLLPWLPSFVSQVRYTGTPWGLPPRARAVFDIVLQFAGGFQDTAVPLGLLLYGLLALGLCGTAGGGGLITLDLRGRPPGRMLAATVGLTMALAVVVGQITGSAFAIRYASVVLPMVLLLGAVGTATLADTWVGPATLALAVVLGFATAIPNLAGDRTTAARVAAALQAGAQPGDVVAYCPDQLGPAVDRVLERGSGPELVQITFPRGRGPELVDWVGYEAANKAAATGPFARMLLDRAGADRSVWVVWAPNYRTFGTKCQDLLTDLHQARPWERKVLTVSTNTFERPGLVQYPPG
jgi:mannosyltransferase